MLARPSLDRDLHRALVDAGYAPLTEYVEMYDMSDDVPATADPVPAFEDEALACLDRIGEHFTKVEDRIAALVAENERLQEYIRMRDAFIAARGMWNEFLDTIKD
jgi:predicted nuclease with TOPRIM domain